MGPYKPEEFTHEDAKKIILEVAEIFKKASKDMNKHLKRKKKTKKPTSQKVGS